jgi:hypothetical protein
VLPTSIQLYRQAQLLPTKVVEGEDGCTTVALLEGVPADSSGELSACQYSSGRDHKHTGFGAVRRPALATSHPLPGPTSEPRSAWPAHPAAGCQRCTVNAATSWQDHSVVERWQQDNCLVWTRIEATPLQGGGNKLLALSVAWHAILPSLPAAAWVPVTNSGLASLHPHR